MDIHKPKPWHGVREFLKEYAIIVVGVLTALAAEQIVVAVDWQRRVHDAEAHMRSDLADDARFAFERMATSDCVDQQIAARRAVLVKNLNDGVPVPPQPKLSVGTRNWLDGAWESARSLQLTGHMPTQRLRDYDRAFAFVRSLRNLQTRIVDVKPEVETMAFNAGRITPTERDRLFLALQRVDTEHRNLDFTAVRFLEAARTLGIEVSPDDRKMILASNISSTGPCVTDPSARLASDTRGVDWYLNPHRPH